MPDWLTFVSFFLSLLLCGHHPWCLLSLVCCLWARFSKQSASSQPQQPTDPVRSAQHSRAEQSQATRSEVRGQRSEVTATTGAVTGCCAGLNWQSGFWGARLQSQSQFDEIRINRPLDSISHPLPPTPRLTLFSHLRPQPFFPPAPLLAAACSCHFSQPRPASSPADALRCTCRHTEPSRGESRPLSARLPLATPSWVLNLPTGLQTTSRCEPGSSVRAQQQIDWPSACNNIGRPDHFRPAHHHPAVPIFTPCCCCLLPPPRRRCWTEASTLQFGFPI